GGGAPEESRRAWANGKRDGSGARGVDEGADDAEGELGASTLRVRVGAVGETGADGDGDSNGFRGGGGFLGRGGRDEGEGAAAVSERRGAQGVRSGGRERDGGGRCDGCGDERSGTADERGDDGGPSVSVLRAKFEDGERAVRGARERSEGLKLDDGV